ncbi:MAG: ECF transporter S component [Syntrophaceae bacterium]|nr:ECF transporter S component [Syntrophaceae bacterium]
MNLKNLLPGKNFTLSEGLWLGFCATFIVLTKAVFRLHLHLTGHAMFFTMFFLLLGRGVVSKRGAATFIALVAGILSMLLGMGKDGPLIILKYVISGLVIDIGFFLQPRIVESYVGCALVAALASTSRVITLVLAEWLAGMDGKLIFQHAVIDSAMNMLFGVLGSLTVPPIIKRLKAGGLIHKESEGR